MVRNYTKKLGSDVVKKRLPLRDLTQLMGQYDQVVTVLSVLFVDTTGKESRTTKGGARSEEARWRS